MANSSLPIIRDSILIALGANGVEVSGQAVLMNNLIDAPVGVYANAGATAYVLDNEGVTTGGAGTVIPMTGDRSAYDVINYAAQHASDLAASAPTRHVSLPGSIGTIPISDGSKWGTSLGTLTFAAGKNLTINNSITLAGVDGKVLTLTTSLTNQGGTGIIVWPAAGGTLTLNTSLTWPLNAAGYLTNDGAGVLTWSATTTPSAHNILSAQHGDTLAGSVLQGDLVVGNATPKWARLAVSVPAVNILNYLGVNNGETAPTWKSASSKPGAAVSMLATDASGDLWIEGIVLTANANIIGRQKGGIGAVSYINWEPTAARINVIPDATGTFALGAGTLSVSSVQNYNIQDHTHVITSSSNPGVAASILATDASGNLTLAGVLTVSNAAPSIVLTDTTASAKSLTIAVDANVADFRESAGAAGSLFQLDLANNTIGIGAAAVSTALLYMSGTRSVAPGTQWFNILNYVTVAPTADHTSSIYGDQITLRLGANVNYTNVFGGVASVANLATGAGSGKTIAAAYLFQTQYSSAAAGTVTSLINFIIQSPSLTAGAISTATGLNIQPQKITGVTTGIAITQVGSSDTNSFAGITTFSNSTDSSNLVTGGVIISGGLGVTKKAYIGSDVNLTTKITTYNNVATEGYGVGAIVDDVALTNQGADIASTNFTNAGTAGTYLVTLYLVCTTADASAGVVTATLAWNDGSAAHTSPGVAINLSPLGNYDQLVRFIKLGSGSISYSTSHTGSYLTAKYALYISCIRLS